jgi:ankyrin repeat protein
VSDEFKLSPEEDLGLAAAKGQFDEVKRLLDAGADPNWLDELGWTALHHAVDARHIGVARLLLSRGADANAHNERMAGETPLGLVAQTCSAEMARILVRAGANPTIPGGVNLTALDRARARKRGDGPEVYRVLVEAAQRWRPGIR